MKNQTLPTLLNQILVAVFLVLFVSSGHAALQAYESFNYSSIANGTAAPTGTPTQTASGGYSGTWTFGGGATASLVTGGLSYSGLLTANKALSINPVSGSYIQDSLATTLSSGTYYISYLFQPGTATSGGNNGSGFVDSGVQMTPGGQGIFLGLESYGATQAKFTVNNVASGYNDNGTALYQDATADITYGAVNLIVLKLVNTSGNTWSASIWVNPTAGTSSEPTANGTFTATFGGAIAQTALLNRSAVANTLTFDEIRVATTWADAVSYTIAAPGAPTGLMVTSTGNNSVSLSWTAPSTGGAVSTYNVMRSTTSGGTYTTVGTTTAPTVTYTDSVTGGSTYYYEVAAVNAGGTTVDTSYVSASPTLGVPNAPTGLTPTPGNNQVALTWTASTVGSPTSYTILRGTSSGGETSLATGVSGTSYTDTTAVNGTPYYYKVAGVNSAGTGTSSSEVTATPAAYINVYEPFNYSSLASGTAGTGTGETGNWSASGTIATTTGLTYSTLTVANNALNVTGGRAAISFGSTSQLARSGTKWISYLVKAPANANWGANMNGVYLLNGGTGLYIGYGLSPYSSSQSYFGLGSTTTTGTTLSSVSGLTTTGSGLLATYSTTYLVVISIQYNTSGANDTVSLYINPTLGQSTPGITAQLVSTGFSVGTITGFGVNAANGPLTIDEIRTGSTYADVIGYNPAPSTPTGVTATANTSSVGLSWTASAGATSYNVLRGTTSGTYPTTNTTTSTTYTDSSVANGTQYYYVIEAVNGNGTSANSTQVTATPIAQPTSFTATGGANLISLSWSAAAGATSYNVKRSTASGTETNYATGVTGTSYTDVTVTPGTLYYYMVSGTNSTGESTKSTEQSATATLAPPPAPTGVTATPNSTPQVVLKWNAAVGATSYIVLSSTNSGAETNLATGVTGTNYTDSTAADGTIVYYQVQAVNGGGPSTNSVEVSAAMPPSSPTGLSATPGINQVVLNWTAPTGVSGATSYNVLRGTTSGGETSLQTGVTGTTFTDSGATDGHTYYYVVVAVNSSGHSPNSSEASALLVPATPAGVSETPGDSQVVLTWSAASGATSYNVLQSTTSGGPYTTLTTAGAQTATSYTDTTAVDGTIYYYVIQGANATGNSLNSAEVSSEPAQALTGLSATPGSNYVSLAWNASTGAASYNVKRSSTSGAETTITNVTAASYVDTNAADGNTYYYEVAAVNPTGQGANSAEVSVLMQPAIPGNVTETPADTQVTLTWSAASGATSYNVLQATISGAETLLTNVTNTSFVDTNTSVDGTTNYYIIQATNATGIADSVEVASEPVQTPTGLTATANSTPEVVLSWTSGGAPVGAATFTVLRSTTSGAETTLATGVATTGYTDTTAVPGNTYYYVVAGANGTGQGSNSTEASAIMVPVAPAGVTQSPGDGQVVLSWSAASGATSYNVLRSTTSGSGYSAITTAGAQTTTTYTDSTAVDGTTYYYVIQAVNATGNSPNSSQVTSAPIAAVTGLGATAGNNSVALTWTAASGATSYNVLRSTTSGSGYAAISTAGAVTAAAYTDSTALNGTTYYYVVQSANATGTSANSSQVSAAPTGPQAPTGLTATGGSGQIALSWTAVTGATSYNVKRSTTSGSGYITITTAGAQTTTAFTDTGTAPGTTYYYVVSSVNGVGESANSAQASAAPNASGASVYEPFNYSSIATGTAHTGTGETGNWTGSASIATGLTYSGLTTAYGALSEGAGNAYVGLAGSYGTSSIYVSFLWNQPANQGGVVGGLELVNSSGNGIVVGNTQPNTGTVGGFGVNQISTFGTVGSSVGTGSTSSDTYGTTYLVVVQLTSNGTGFTAGSVWLNPTTSGSSPGTATFTFSGVTAFTLANLGIYSGNGTRIVDEVRVATSYAAVVGQTAPSAPGGLGATPLSGQVNLTWSSVSGATSYNVLRSTISGAEQSLVTGLTSPAYTDSSVANGTTYYYKVQSVNGIGGSGFSSEVSATPVAVPGQPTGLGATTSANTVNLSWTAPSSGGPVVSYTVLRGTASGGETPYVTGLTGTTYTDNGAAGNTTYYYEVEALNGSGTGTPSSEISATPPIAQPIAPASLTATANTTPQVVLSWPVGTGAASYNVYRSTTSGSGFSIITTPGQVTTTSYTNTSVANGNVYYYEITSTNSAGESVPTSQATANMAPAAPTAFAATAGSNQVALSWTASAGASGATSYNVLRSTTSGSGYITLIIGVSGTTYTDSTALSGTTYYYKVVGVNTTGQGTISSEQSAAPTGAPQAPTGVSATANNGNVILAWTAALGNPSSYNVLRSTTSGAETTLVTGVTGTGYTDSGASPGTTYYYLVQAVNTYGTSANSSEVSATPTSGGLIAYDPMNYSGSQINTTTASPTGTPTQTTGGGFTGNWSGGALSYSSTGLTYSGLPTTGGSVASLGANALYETLSGAPASGSVWISFIDYQGGDNGGARSGVTLEGSNGTGVMLAYQQFGPTSGEPCLMAMSLNTVIGSQLSPYSSTLQTYANNNLYVLKLTYTAGVVSSISVYSNPTANQGTAPTPDFTVTSGLPTMGALAKIGFVDPSGEPIGIDEFRVGTSFGAVVGLTAPSSAPAGVSATGGNNSVALSWSSVSGATSYNVLRSTASGAEQSLTTGLTGTTYTDSTAINGTTYYYVVQAANGVGGSAFSSEVSATPAPIPPTANPAVFHRANNISLKIAIADLLTNVSNPDGNPLTLVGVGTDGYNLTTTNGVTLTTNGTFVVYADTVGGNVNDRFEYTVSDGVSSPVSGMVTIIVAGGQTGQNNATVSSTSTNATVTYFGIPGYTYVAQRATNLTPPVAWVNLSTNVASTNGVMQVIDSFGDLSGPPAQSYYRLLAP